MHDTSKLMGRLGAAYLRVSGDTQDTASQKASVERSLPEFRWTEARPVPRSLSRVVLLGQKSLG